MLRHAQGLALRLAPLATEAPYVLDVPWLLGMSPEERIRMLLHRAVTSEQRHALPPLVDAVERLSLITSQNVSETLRQLEEEVIPSCVDLHAPLVLVLDALERLDPGGAAQAWTEEVRLHGRDAPGRPAIPPAEPGFLARVRSFLVPLAEAAGMWTERCALEDLHAAHTMAPAFSVAERFARARPHEAWLDEALPLLRSILEPHGAEVGDFELRHLASLASALGTSGEVEWPDRLARLGFVPVRARPGEAYAALGVLHNARPHVPGSIADLRRRSGYRAVHTRIELPVAGRARAVSVRIDTDREGVSRRPGLAYALARLREEVGVAGAGARIRVYTPAGDVRRLVERSTVANFALAISARHLNHLDHAVVNGRRVDDPLHVLDDGDTVRLVLSRDAHPLPDGWRGKVPPGTDVALHRAQRDGLRDALLAVGRRWLRSRLLTHGLDLPAGGVERVVEAVLTGPIGRDQFPTSPRAVEHTRLGRLWLVEIGRYAAEGAQDEVSVWARRDLDRTALRPGDPERLVELVHRMLTQVTEMDVPRALVYRARDLQRCPDCDPLTAGPLAVAHEDGVLVLHRPDALCAPPDATRVEKRLAFHQFIVCEAENRPGLLRDVLDHTQELGVDLQEVVACRVDDMAVLRLEADCPDDAAVERLVSRISEVAGIRRTLGPQDPKDPLLERPLPPRRHAQPMVDFRPSPVVVNQPVHDDAYFVGRESQLGAVLRGARRGVLLQAANQAFVTGPLRSGKTSLAYKVMRTLDASTDRKFVIAHAEALEGESWTAFSARLARHLWQAARETLGGGRLPPLPPPGFTLLDVLGLLNETEHASNRDVFLFIDECTRLVATVGADPEEDAEAGRFVDLIGQTRGVFVLWAGPLAHLHQLPSHGLRDRLAHKLPRVLVDTMSVAEFHALATGAQHAGRHAARVDDELANGLHALTGGDVYWAAWLVQLLVDQHRDRSPERLAPSKERLERVTRALLVRHRETLDVRLRSVATPNRALAEKVLRLLAGPDLPVLGREAFEGTDAPRAESALLDDTLRDLVDGGLLDATERGYRVRAPLFAHFLRGVPDGSLFGSLR